MPSSRSSPPASPTTGPAKPSKPRSPMQPDDPSLAEEEVLAHGGWHPRYARVLAVASDGDYGDYGFAVVDGNADSADLEGEMWRLDCGNCDGAGASGAGLLATLWPPR